MQNEMQKPEASSQKPAFSGTPGKGPGEGISSFLLALALICIPTPISLAQSTPAPLPLLQGRPDQSDDNLTGPTFDDPMQGIALSPPANCQTIRQNLAASDIAEFVNPDLSWILKVSRAQLPKPITLSSPTGKPGLLELTAQQFVATNSSAKVLRQEATQISHIPCGILVAHYTQANQPRLMQQAMLRVDDQVYFVLTMTSPGQVQEERAIKTFNAVLNSVRLIDRSKIREDQNERLLHFRDFYAGLTAEKIQSVLAPESFDRITQNGHDIGYRYVVEQTEKRFDRDGFRIGIRLHVEPAGAPKVDKQAWLTCSFDHTREEWSIGAQTTAANGKQAAISELGTTTRYSEKVFDPVNGVADPKDPTQPRVRTQSHYELYVTRITASGTGKPIKQELPPYYVPEALDFVLPALLAQQPPSTYMVATWDDDQKGVIRRYLDVGREQSVELDGKTVNVIPVEDRVGLEGETTIHYILPGSREIATRNPAGVLSLSTDRATLLSLYKTAILTPPGDSSR